jgi:hypothetical protein
MELFWVILPKRPQTRSRAIDLEFLHAKLPLASINKTGQ